eukprot:630159-Amphidinium_carterae.2
MLFKLCCRILSYSVDMSQCPLMTDTLTTQNDWLNESVHGCCPNDTGVVSSRARHPRGPSRRAWCTEVSQVSNGSSARASQTPHQGLGAKEFLLQVPTFATQKAQHSTVKRL